MHPTGFPAFTLLAGIFAHAFPAGAVSWRIALFCALAMSGCAWLVYRIVCELCESVPAAIGSAWLFAFGSVIWIRGTRPEIHDLALFFTLLALYCVLRWYRTQHAAFLSAAALSYGLGLATHSIVAFAAPALGLLVLLRAGALRWRECGAAALALVTGLAVYAYLPIRSAVVDSAHLDPAAALGKPPGNAFWNTDDPSQWTGFIRLVSGSDFPTGDALRSMFDPSVYAANGPQLVLDLYKDFTVAGLLLALAGAVAIFRRDRWLAIAFLLLALLPSAFVFGYTVVADMHRYFFDAVAVTAVFCGTGAGAIAALPGRYARLAAFVPALLAIVLLCSNRATFEQRFDRGASSLIAGVARATPDTAVIVAPWQQATALAYGAYVDGRLRHRIIDSSWYEDDAQYIPAWVKRYPVFVVGSPWGYVKGYELERVSISPEIYRVVSK